jgi:hypothetical protein
MYYQIGRIDVFLSGNGIYVPHVRIYKQYFTNRFKWQDYCLFIMKYKFLFLLICFNFSLVMCSVFTGITSWLIVLFCCGLITQDYIYFAPQNAYY